MKSIISLTLLSCLLSSCAGSHTGRIASNTLAGAGGAILANDLSEGNSAWTAVGAAAGVIGSETVQHIGNKKAKESYDEGYDKGRSDAVKQQYWLTVDSQRDQSEDSSFSFYEIPVPEQRVDGALLLPSKHILRIQD